MYNELYETWKRELEEIKLEKLSTDFYSKLADYMQTLRKESRMLDKRTVKARLLKNETRNVKHMVHELIQTRYRKIVMKAAEGERVPLNFLTAEEKKVYTGVLPFAEAYHDFAESLLSGRMLKLNVKRTLRRAVLRFLKEVPAIIGADMEAYGPFKVEDVASLPLENSRILVKQGLAELINV